MQHNPVFPLKGILLSGVYLLGDYAWSEAMRLESASLIAAPPLAGQLTLTLEVDGVLTNKSFVLGPSVLPEIRQSLALGIRLAVGQTVRWKAVAFTGQTEEAPDSLSVTLTANREVDTTTPTNPMTVWWRNAGERYLLFTYDPVTHLYTATALAATRATITDLAGVFTIALEGTPALRVQGQVLFTNAIDSAGNRPDKPSLVFYLGSTPIATLTQTGSLHVPNAEQLVPVDQTDQFLLGVGAALNPGGVLAESFTQPL